MKFKMSSVPVLFVLCLACGVAVGLAPAAAAKEVPGAPLDHVSIHVSSISKDTPVRVQAFPSTDASMGHAKKAAHQEQAKRMMKESPGLLLNSLVSKLEAAGFSDVAVLEAGAEAPSDAYVIEGEFTVLHPGSQQERIWFGLGAGKSKTCIAGKVTQGGKTLADFQNCRVGVTWTKSEHQIEEDATETGANITGFMHHWAEGDYK